MINMEAKVIRLHVTLLLLVIITLSWIPVDAGLLATPSPPRFKQDILPNKVALVDNAVKFVCRATGRPKPYVSWYYNNELLATGERIKITKHSLKISNLKMSDGGKYTCRVRNDNGEIWGNFSLQVFENENNVSPPHRGENYVDKNSVDKGPPVFNEGPAMVGYIARAATALVVMDCSVRSYSNASITWWRDRHTQPIVENIKYVLEGFTLKISSLTLEDTGDYTCIVSNEHGHINHTYKLEVQQRVAIAPMMEDVKNQTVIEGDNATFTCKIVMSDSHPYLQWLRHYMVNDSFTNEKGEPYVKMLQQAGFLRTIGDPTELVLTDVTQEDEGWYTCLVANTVGMNYRSAWLEVLNEREAEELEVEYLSRPPTASVVMNCSANSNPKSSITWRKDKDTQITAGRDKHNIVLEGYTLTIKSITTKDTGYYTCIVSNEYGNFRNTYKLEVQQRVASIPMMEDLKNQTAIEGENVTFSCNVVLSDTQPELHWLRPYMANKPFTNENREPYFKVLQQSGYLRTIGDPEELVLTNVTQEYEGWYMCLVSNTNGMNYRSAWLEVLNESEAKSLRETK